MKRLFLLILIVLYLTACGGTAMPTPASPAPIVSPNPIVPSAPTATSAPMVTSVPTSTPQPIELAQPVAPVVGLPRGTDDQPWWNDSVFYEIFVRSFADSDGNGIGDFNGLISKLDYLHELGITGLWLMPIHPSPSYHGYDVADYYTVNPQYGTLDDFKRLLDEAHRRGIRVIIDLVLNHTSDQHAWFQAALDPQSPFREWYVWSQTDPGQAGWRRASSGDYYYGYFTDGMPDLNYRTSAVTEKMNDVVRFWLQDVGVDGFRLDAAKYLIEDGTSIQNTAATHHWYENFRPVYKQLNPQALTIGEVWDIPPTSAEYAQGDELDLTFDFGLAEAYILAMRSGRASEVVEALNINRANFKPNQFGAFLANHDQNRVMSQVGASIDKARVGAWLYLTGPGVPFVYYGEEIGMLGRKPDEDIRLPMQWNAEANAGFTTGRPWRPAEPSYTQYNVAAEDTDPNSLLALYRTLIGLRNQHAALRVGDVNLPQSSNANVFASLRMSKDEAVLIVVNLSKDAVVDVKLTLDTSALKAGSYRAVRMTGEASLPELTVNAQGGFDVTLSELAGFGGVMFQLRK